MTSRDPLSIGSYNYNLGLRNKTEIHAIYRQLLIYDLPKLNTRLTRQEIIEIILKSKVGRFFSVKGTPQNANINTQALYDKNRNLDREDAESSDDSDDDSFVVSDEDDETQDELTDEEEFDFDYDSE